MAKEAILRAESRTETGKGAAGRLRRSGYVPAIMYGHGEEPSTLKVEAKELGMLLERISADNTLVDLTTEGGESKKVLIREIQRHPYKSEILHVDFFHIREDEKIRVEVPLHFVGTAAGVKNSGGILQQNRHQIEVECLPGEIPEFFELDVSSLDIGDSLHVADLNTGGVRPLEELDLTLCTVVPPTVITVEEEEEAEAALEELEPEVIGRMREEEGEELEGEEVEREEEEGEE